MQIIDIYIGKVKKEIYKLSPADDFLNELKSNLIEYSEDNPNCTMDDLIEQFGMPEDIAKEFLDNTVTYTPKIIAKKRKRKKIIIVLLCVTLIIVAIYCIIHSMQTQSMATDVITIYEESIHGNEYLGDWKWEKYL